MKNRHELGDAELVTYAQRGDFGAFDTLVTRYERLIFSYALAISTSPRQAEHFTELIFLRAMDDLGPFDARLGFQAWLWAAAAGSDANGLR